NDWSRERIIDELGRRGVPCFQGSCSEVYREKAFDDTPWRPSEPLPVAQELGQTSLMFLVHPTLTEADLVRTVEGIGEVFGQMTGSWLDLVPLVCIAATRALALPLSIPGGMQSDEPASN